MSTTSNTRFINASPERIYNAFADPAILQWWLVPGRRKEKGVFQSRFISLQLHKKIVLAICFDTANSAMTGEMIMEVDLAPSCHGTAATIIFKNTPSSITASALEKLAQYAE